MTMFAAAIRRKAAMRPTRLCQTRPSVLGAADAPQTVRHLAAAILLLAVVFGAAGCGQPSGGGRLSRPLHLYVGLDASRSWRRHLPASVGLCAGQALALDPTHDRLTVFRVDADTREFYNDRAPASRLRFQASVNANLEAVSATRGTFPARFWETVAERAAQEQGPVAIALYSDGDNDDQRASSQEALRRAARRLADNPHVQSVTFFGADPHRWVSLRQAFGPLGARLHLYAAPEMTPDRAARALTAPDSL